jgi:hypothetical protein
MNFNKQIQMIILEARQAKQTELIEKEGRFNIRLSHKKALPFY